MSSQSGALGLAMLALARQRHVGISTFVSVGNKADISGNDLLQYWQGDEATRVILLYLESFGNPRRFARIARGVSRAKPIVVVKAGRRAASLEDRVGRGGSRGGRRPGGRALPPDGRHPGRDAGRDVRSRRRARPAAAAGGAPRRDPLGRRRPRHPLRGRLRGGAAVRASALRLDDKSASRPSSRPRRRSAIPWSWSRLVRRTRTRGRSSRSSSLAEVDAVIAIHTPLDANESAAMLEAIRQGTAARARGGRRRQAGPGLPRGEGGRRRADRPRRREHSHVRVPGIGRARAREGRGVRGVASGPARDHSRLRRHRPRLRARNLPEGDRGARSRLAHGGRGESGPSGHAPSRRSGRGRPHGRRGRQGGPERRVPGRRQARPAPGFFTRPRKEPSI